MFPTYQPFALQPTLPTTPFGPTPFGSLPGTPFTPTWNGWGPAGNFNLFASPFFQQTLTALVAQAVQQAVWQAASMQWQPQALFGTPFTGNGPSFSFQAFPFQGAWNNAQWNTGQWNATNSSFPAINPFNQPVNGQSFTQFPNPPQTFGANQGHPYIQPPQSTWLNGQGTQGYFGSAQFQQNANGSTHEPVEAATKRNGSR